MPPPFAPSWIQRGIVQCDYIISGIPFSILEKEKKRNLLQQTHEALAPGGAFIIYQVTNELRQHATDFASAESEYFLQNIPPMFITVFRKAAALTETARSIRRLACPRTTRDEKRGNAHRKGFDGRDGGAERRPLWRVDPARGLEFSGERLSIQPRRSFARSA